MDAKLKAFIEECQAAGIPVTVSLNLTVALVGTVGQPPPLPVPDLPLYSIDASSKTSKKLKLRTAPSPTAEGPTVGHGEVVAYLGHMIRYGKTNYMQVRTLDDTPLVGWVEEEFLKEKK